MGTYVVTGSASGMGGAAANKLRAEGHTVIGIDLKEAEIIADLSTAQGRSEAIAQALELSGGELDGAVLAAGVGPIPGKENAKLILEVNYYGITEVLEGLRPALAKKDSTKVVVVGSNSTTTMPLVPAPAVKALKKNNVERAVKWVSVFGDNTPSMAYGASKIAVTQWARAQAVTAQWAGEGIHLNVIAPGAILTPLLEKQLSTPEEAAAVESFPVPIGGYGKPEEIAEWIYFMLSDTASFLCGSVITVDGGSDAWFRANDWPKPVPATKLKWYKERMKEFSPYSKRAAK